VKGKRKRRELKRDVWVIEHIEVCHRERGYCVYIGSEKRKNEMSTIADVAVFSCKGLSYCIISMPW